MGYLFLSNFIDDPELVSALSRQILVNSEEQSSSISTVRTSQTTYKRPKGFSVEIPKECVIFEIPENIKGYLTSMYDNFRSYLRMKKQYRNSENIIAEFVLYLLEPGSDGRDRYQTYDPIKFPGVDYAHWCLTQLRFFHLKTVCRKDKSPEVSCDPEEMMHTQVDASDPCVVCQVKEMQEKMRDMVINSSPTEHFKKNVVDLYWSRVEQEKNLDFASRKEVSPSATSQWASKLKDLALDYVDTDLCFLART